MATVNRTKDQQYRTYFHKPGTMHFIFPAIETSSQIWARLDFTATTTNKGGVLLQSTKQTKNNEEIIVLLLTKY